MFQINTNFQINHLKYFLHKTPYTIPSFKKIPSRKKYFINILFYHFTSEVCNVLNIY